MAEVGAASSKCDSGEKPLSFTLHRIVEVFNAPLNEEQAWAVCYQCVKRFKTVWSDKYQQCYCFANLDSVKLFQDGSVEILAPPFPKSADKANKPGDLIESLGLVIYRALDYGLEESEERSLSADLEGLIMKMTGNDDGKNSDTECDEGIENDQEEEKGGLTFEDVLKACTHHVAVASDAANHYKAVCRALVAEAQELIHFLEKISTQESKLPGDELDGNDLEDLKKLDWARLWMQVLRQLRHGVRLKSVTGFGSKDCEFELTPYEILMEDIRTRRYTLNKVMVNGDIPPKVKEDAHAMILDFIRSRPPLHPMKERQLKSPVKEAPNLHEQLLDAIKSAEPKKLRPVCGGGKYDDSRRFSAPPAVDKPGKRTIKAFIKTRVETSRTKLFEDATSPQPTRKLIKADMSLFQSYSDDDMSAVTSDDEDDDDDGETTDCADDDEVFENRQKIEPEEFNPPTPLDSPTMPWQKRLALDLTLHNTARPRVVSERRHSITVCESPMCPPKGKVLTPSPCMASSSSKDSTPKNDPGRPVDPHATPWRPKASPLGSPAFPLLHISAMGLSPLDMTKLNDPMKCLSLTVEEVMHIRNVLTKAELECLLVNQELYKLVSKGKICFTCKKTKFSIFGEWSTKCKFCKRAVCSKCARKMRIPTEHFENIPVYTLSPSPLSPTSETAILAYEGTGSAPGSPAMMPGKIITSITKPAVERRSQFQRAATMAPNEKPPSPTSLQGPQMTICRDCKVMIVNIIRASRTSLMKARAEKKKIDRDTEQETSPNNNKAKRDFHLNLKPVYK
ncbi:protein spire homolog 1-like isoform X3 [Lineus longissimus]|uniref:protein spire homolog 1-like isoform X3 n=1 Tax=Lineus longissimus TaxID=88925 RepID=UPI00315D2760